MRLLRQWVAGWAWVGCILAGTAAWALEEGGEAVEEEWGWEEEAPAPAEEQGEGTSWLEFEGEEPVEAWPDLDSPPSDEKVNELMAPGRSLTAEEEALVGESADRQADAAGAGTGTESLEQVWKEKGYSRAPTPGEKEKRPDLAIGNSPFLKDYEEAAKTRSR